MVFDISKQYRHFRRYRQIAEILLKNGLGFIVDWLDLSKYLPFNERFKKEGNNYPKKNLAKRVRFVLQELGPTYIKLGQTLSTRADILPPDYIKEFKKLQDKVTSVPFSEISKILKEDLNDNLADIFQKVDYEPKAAASIAQTHHAILKDGTDVIIKVQRPGIEEKVRVDLEILARLAFLAEERGLSPEYIKPTKVVDELSRSLKKELNFQREIANIKRFKDNFKQEKRIIVPKIYTEFSSKRVLVLEEIKGIKLNQLEESKLNRSSLASLGAKSLMKQILIDGFFHADPHPGNIFVVNNDKLAYIDFGLMGELTDEDRDKIGLLFIAFLKKDVNIIVDLVIDLGSVSRDLNIRKFRLAIQDLLNQYYGVQLGSFNFKEVTDDLQRILYDFNIKMPEEFFLLIRAISISEGVGYMLDPSFDFVKAGSDFVKDFLLKKINLENLFAKFVNVLWNLRKSTKGLPEKLTYLLNKIIDDEFTIRFKHINLENLINKIDIISNRLSFSLIISALIIGSSMILQTELKPLIYGIPVLGFIGFVVAGIMGLWLVIAIFRSGRF